MTMPHFVSSGRLHELRRGGPLLAVVGLLAFGHAPTIPPSIAPFELDWLEGRCVGCQIARRLGPIQLTTALEGWAVGVNFPRVGEGTGDYVVVHTRDGG